MDNNPNTASATFVSPICLKTPAQIGIKASDFMCNPNKDFTCVVAIVTADAEVKPAITGKAIKSSRAPKADEIKQ